MINFKGTATNSLQLNGQAPSYYLNYNNFFSEVVYVPTNTVTRTPIVANGISNVGYQTRAAIGLRRANTDWGEALISVGNNDVGTSFVDFAFNVNGRITSPAGTFALLTDTVAGANYANSAGSASFLERNDIESKNSFRMQFFQGAQNSTRYPTVDWWSLVRTQHGGYENGYWQEMAYGFGISPTSLGIRYRTNVNGTFSEWYNVGLQSKQYGHWGMNLPDSNTYIRTPPEGLIPNSSNPSGVSRVGTVDWPFIEMHAKSFYGTASNAVNAQWATSAGTANALNGFYLGTSVNPIAADNLRQNAIAYVNGISQYGQVDGGIYAQFYSPDWGGQIYQDYRTGGLSVRGMLQGSWTGWKQVLDTGDTLILKGTI